MFGASNTFGAPAFGAPQQQQRAFGAPQQSPFGAPQQQGFGGGQFGQQPTASPGFGGVQSAFGQPATPGGGAFGQPAAATGGAFGAPQQQGGFFGGGGAFGAPQQPAFGAPQQQSAFGAPQQSAFGAPQQNAFGAPQQQGAFGAPQQQGAFGAPQQQSAFGTPQQQSAFGAPQQQSAFGAPQQQGGLGGFGTQSAFSQPQQQQQMGGFPGQGGQQPPRPVSTFGSDNYMNIGVQREFQDKSLEEIRMEEYQRAGKLPGGGGAAPGMWGQSAAPVAPQQNAWGAPQLGAAPAAAPAWGATTSATPPAWGPPAAPSTGTSLFGGQSTSTLTNWGATPAAAPAAPAWGTSNTGSGGLFGNNNTTTPAWSTTTSPAAPSAGGSVFGNNNNTGGLFGSNNQQQQQPAAGGGLWGQTAPPAGAPPAGGGGIFGTQPSTPAAPAWGSTSAFSSPSQGTSLFGGNTGGGSGGLFGNNNAANTSFGATNTGGGGLFANANNSSFGALSPSSSNASSGGLFGNATTSFGTLSNTGSGGLFDANKSGMSGGGSMFGNNNMFQQQPQQQQQQQQQQPSVAPNAESQWYNSERLQFENSEASKAWPPVNKADAESAASVTAQLPVSTPTRTLLSANKPSFKLKSLAHGSSNSLALTLPNNNATLDSPNAAPPLEVHFKAPAYDLMSEESVKLGRSAHKKKEDRVTQVFEDNNTSNSLAISTPPAFAQTKDLPKVLRGYTISPTLEELEGMQPDELARVSNFTVRREGVGSIEWEGEVDVRGAVIGKDIVIDSEGFEVYGDDKANRVEVGTKLNRAATCSFVFEASTEEEASKEYLEELLHSMSRAAHFKSYENNLLVFEVDHFAYDE